MQCRGLRRGRLPGRLGVLVHAHPQGSSGQLWSGVSGPPELLPCFCHPDGPKLAHPVRRVCCCCCGGQQVSELLLLTLSRPMMGMVATELGMGDGFIHRHVTRHCCQTLPGLPGVLSALDALCLTGTQELSLEHFILCPPCVNSQRFNSSTSQQRSQGRGPDAAQQVTGQRKYGISTWWSTTVL